MSRQNRVTPFNEIVAYPERGTFTGNRGILHDADGQLTGRRWTHKRSGSPACWSSKGGGGRADHDHFKQCWLAGA